MGALQDAIRRGTAAARPAIADVSIGTLYYSTDTAVTERSNGTSWETYSDAGSGGITQLTGNVTAGPGSGSVAATIANDAVTYAKIQNVTDVRLLGRAAGSAGDVQEITVSGATLAAGVLTVTGGNNDWTTIITKSVNQDVTNSSVLVDDTELQLPVTAADVYLIQLLIIYSATDATRDLLWDVAVSAGVMSGVGMHYGLSSGDTPIVGGLGLAEVADSSNVTMGTAAAAGVRAFEARFMISFSATGTFKFRFAQSSIGGGTVSTCRAKSKLRALKVSP